MTATVYVNGTPVAISDLRYDFADGSGQHLIVCDAHTQWAQNRCGNYLRTSIDPSGPIPACVACTNAEPIETHPVDSRGRTYCGQDFMAGTICTLPPDHDGHHAPICQECNGDWYDGTCTCSDDEDEEE